MSSILIRNLTKRFGQQTVVDRVSFDVDHGSFLVVLGPSGCGKSTILRMIAGLEEPDEGEIFLNAKNVAGIDPSKRGISMVFQSYALFPHLSVAENIIFGLKVRRIPKNERGQRLERVASLVGLSGELDKKPAQLSGGQRQRVALARAVIAEHPVCLMDEPLSNLDAKLRHEMRMEIRDLQRRLRLSVVYVTHDQTEAMSMADKILVVREGRVEQLGTPSDIYKHPSSAFVAGFIGSPPMNIISLAKIGEACANMDVSLERLLPVQKLNGSSLGMRPEDLRLTTSGPGLPVRVQATDYHGADTMVEVRVDHPDAAQDKIMVRVAGKADYDPGRPMLLSWDPEKIHLFDAQGGSEAP
ncbi:MAG: ABC transporter ATP-binding protein [Desulfovermiculus sp.]